MADHFKIACVYMVIACGMSIITFFGGRAYERAVLQEQLQEHPFTCIQGQTVETPNGDILACVESNWNKTP